MDTEKKAQQGSLWTVNNSGSRRWGNSLSVEAQPPVFPANSTSQSGDLKAFPGHWKTPSFQPFPDLQGNTSPGSH